MNDDEPRYDYEVPNSDIVSNDERKAKLLKEIGGLLKHVAFKCTEVAGDIGQDNGVPWFNDTLAVPDHLSAAPNPLATRRPGNTPNMLTRSRAKFNSLERTNKRGRPLLRRRVNRKSI